MKEKIFFEGKWQEGINFFPVYKKGTKEILYKFPETTYEQIERAISYIERKRDIVKELTSYERYKILLKVRDLIEKRSEEISRIISLESGKTINEARFETKRAIETVTFSAEEAKRIYGEYVPMDASEFGKGRMAFTIMEPDPIVLAITPFNFPLNLALHKIAPAIAAGCSVVFKPSSFTPMTGKIITEIVLEAGFPPEGFSFLTGGGGTVGEQLCKDPRIRHISFTGSKEVGERIAKIAGLKKKTFELGSNSALCVFSDFEYEVMLDRILKGAYSIAGQVCISIQRIYVEKKIKEKFIDDYVRALRNLKVGDQLKEDTDVGPMISEDAAIKAEEMVKKAIERGAKVLPELKREGSFLYPLLIVDAPEDCEVCAKEAFAPLAVCNEFETEDELIFKVNNSEYGLQCGILTNNIKRALTLAKKIEVGGVIINDIPSFRVDHMPYGGVKGSGIGREGPKYALRDFVEEKIIVIKID
ncbi:MAG: aldehyde dehydrogenase family protein [Candidatus Hydrothermales bacterium]